MPSRPTKTRFGALFAAILLSGGPPATLAAASDPAPQDVRALLIGVGDYPDLPRDLRLAAPAGDVERLSGALIAAGLPASAVDVLTEAGPTRPTRAAILDRLARLAASARAGEQVLVYFSGHGAQAPARRPGREPDGLEELYLAADARGWDGGTRGVPGSIADFELEAALAAIRARGADVWFIADACHAAGLTRSGGAPGERVKAAPSAALGIPAGAASRGRSDEAAPLRAEPAPGRFTGFYAAAPGALAIERLLPAGAPDARSSSTFTFALARALDQGRFRSFRDLALAAAAASVETGPGAPAPVFEGDLSRDVLGLAPAARAWAVRRSGAALILEAGALEGFAPGAVVELSARTGGDAARATVVEAGPLTAQLAAQATPPSGPLTARLIESANPTAANRGESLLAALAPLAGTGRASGLVVEARLWRAGCGPNPPARDGFPPQTASFDLLAPPPLRHCDVLYLRLRNQGGGPLDVSPLYVDAAGAILALGLAPADQVRIAPGSEAWAAVRLLSRDRGGRTLATGVERLVVLAAEAGSGAPRDLRSLAGPATLRAGAAPPPEPGLAAFVFPLTLVP